MSTKMNKFLEFNGRTIYYLDVNGTNWIAIKPICEAIGVNYEAQRKAIYRDKLLAGVPSNQTVHDSSNRLQQMVCLPEKYIYGWIFRIQSSNDEILPFQQKCYEVLFDHFNGLITKRRQFTYDCADIDSKLETLKKEMQDTIPQFQQFGALLKLKKQIKEELKQLDVQLLTQPTLFE